MSYDLRFIITIVMQDQEVTERNGGAPVYILACSCHNVNPVALIRYLTCDSTRE